ncbi:MAG: class I SAM-dependent methyltransferase [Parvularculaceae bacterium]
MLDRLKQRLRREAFLTTRLSVITSPLYIIRRGLFKAISRLAPEIAGDILDVGCGSKPYESLFTKAQSYVGVDIENSGHSHKDSKIDVYYDGKTLPFPNDHFDAVVSFETLEHVFNVDEVILEIRRVLKPGGRFFLSVPFAWDEHEVPYDFARYTSFGLTHILEKNQFEIIELCKTTTYVSAVCQMFIAYLAQHVSPKSGFVRRVFQLAVIFPLNVLAILLNALLPKRYEYFCNCVVLARKSAG